MADMLEAIVFTAIVLGGLLVRLFMMRKRPMRYRKKPLLTGGERELYFRLQTALPECIVCPQVAVSALLEPAGTGRIRQAAVDFIFGKRVGYALFDRDMSLIAVIELDQRNRASRRAAERDACFASAGIRTIRFQARRLPSEASIRSTIFPRRSRRAISANELRDGEIEFSRPDMSWRDTLNAHA